MFLVSMFVCVCGGVGSCLRRGEGYKRKMKVTDAMECCQIVAGTFEKVEAME